ncbi:MAG: sigma-E factor negative regulatory protein [Betaproteobacteria bacterium]|jgi:sigma-E factor negative regulatory protein RseA|nr:MAG: sigma-E factor negative regulatory protein [Betaproteobacteria bacterium]
MERMSALMDGELEDHEIAGELASIKDDPRREAKWAAYHLIGDVLRGENVIADDFTVRMHVKLSDEPTVLAPRRWMRRTTRRVVLPLAASLCGAAVVAWLALSNNTILSPQDSPVGPAWVATSPPTEQIADLPASEVMSEYLMAHQQFSPSTVRQGVVPYVRTVSTGNGSR